MKEFILSLLVLGIVLCSAANSVIAQPARGRPPGGRSDVRRYMRSVPVLAVLDANGDGEISAEEIKGAATALLKLDKNRDGKLTEDEVRPTGGRPTPRPGRDRPPRPGDRPPRPDEPDRPPRPDDRGRPPGPGSDRQQHVTQSVNRLMAFDKNKDGMLAKDELPESMQTVWKRADRNKDGFATREELTTVFTERGGREGGRPQRPDRPRSD